MDNLKEIYKPVIQKIIDNNKKFYNFSNLVEWDFFENENIAIVGKCQSDFKLYININSVHFAYSINEPLQIEYFLLHEIRHIYQKRLIYDYELKNINKPLADLWKKELQTYKNTEACINNYYQQNIEFDAYSFSYAVMIYKYGNINYIIPPKCYRDQIQFKERVNKLLCLFKSKNF